VFRVAEARSRREPVRMHDDVVDRVVGRVSLRIERNPQIVGAEAVRPLLDEKVCAVRGGENNVRADKGPRAKVEPLAFYVQLEYADVRVLVGCVGYPFDHPARRGGEEQDCEGGGCDRKPRGASYKPHLLPLSDLAGRRYRIAFRWMRSGPQQRPFRKRPHSTRRASAALFSALLCALTEALELVLLVHARAPRSIRPRRPSLARSLLPGDRGCRPRGGADCSFCTRCTSHRKGSLGRKSPIRGVRPPGNRLFRQTS
jgi:hypothetical protein